MRKKKSNDKRNQLPLSTNLWCWAFVSITLIFYIFFQGWPIICSIYYSLLDWSGLTVSGTYIGLSNYKELFQDQLYWNAFFNSFKYTIEYVPLILICSLFLALVLNNRRLGGKTFYRTIYFMPVVTTAAVIGIIMIFIFGTQGPVNEVLKIFHITEKSIGFLTNGKYALTTVVLISVWKDCGIYMIYWIAGLQSIPVEMYEAAELDGANSFQKFYKIILPLIAPTAGIITILCCINSLKVFDIVKTMTEGGPFYKTDVMGTFVYRSAFSSEIGLPRVGYASASAILFGITVIIIVASTSALKNKLSNSSSI
ncbi:MAG: carbohydrate ABC transporter permease [Pleomorphochaeta sp.]